MQELIDLTARVKHLESLVETLAARLQMMEDYIEEVDEDLSEEECAEIGIQEFTQ